MVSFQRLGVLRERCSVPRCKGPQYRADRCRFHWEQYQDKKERDAAEQEKLPPGREWQPTESYVYAVEAHNGLIKIGTARDPEKRIKSLQGQSPVRVDLTLLGYVHGDQTLERMIHRRILAYRAHGEWFEPKGLVLKISGAIAKRDRCALRAALGFNSRAW